MSVRAELAPVTGGWWCRSRCWLSARNELVLAACQPDQVRRARDLR